MKVIIAFDPDHSKIGKTVTVDDDEAALMIREGRARPADGKNAELPLAYQAPTVEPPLPEVIPPLAEQVPGAQPVPASAGKAKASTTAKATTAKTAS